jgi:hypothetical protein
MTVAPPPIHVLDEHQHTVLDELKDTFTTIHVRAVIQGVYGPSVHLGDWSMSADDARLLAASLSILADATEEAHS